MLAHADHFRNAREPWSAASPASFEWDRAQAMRGVLAGFLAEMPTAGVPVSMCG